MSIIENNNKPKESQVFFLSLSFPEVFIIILLILCELRALRKARVLILAMQTGCSAPGCKFNDKSTDVLLTFRPMAENPPNMLAFWDALIVASARNAKAEKILTEDLNHAQQIEGILIEKEITKNARVLAAQRQTSISRMLGEELQKLIEDSKEYDKAKNQALNYIAKGFHIGGGIIVPLAFDW